MEIREQALGPDHVDVAASLYNLAHLHRQQRAYAQAEPLYQRALKIYRKANGSAVEGDVVDTLNELAFVHQRRGDHAEAERFGREALEMARRVFGDNDARVAECSMTLGGVAETLGRYDEAETHYQLALDIREKQSGPDDADVADSIAALAALYDVLGRYAESEPLHKRAPGDPPERAPSPSSGVGLQLPESGELLLLARLLRGRRAAVQTGVGDFSASVRPAG